MKGFWIYILMVLSISYSAYAQEQKVKVKVYKVWVEKIDGAIVKGFLHSATMESFIVNTDKDLDAPNHITIEPKRISKVTVRRKGKVLVGAAVGLIAGTVAGGLVNQEGSLVDTTGINSLTGATMGLLGTGLGALITSAGKKTIVIYSSLDLYREHLEKLQAYSYVIEK